MEEYVGELWDRFIRKVAYRGYPEARVKLEQMAKLAPVFFRALGGDPGLNVTAGSATSHGARRNWVQRVAGTGEKAELAWRDGASLYLPAELDVFPQAALNRDLYLWLIALSAHDCASDLPWLARNQQATLATLQALPGLAGRYQILVEALIAERGDPAKLLPVERTAEEVVRAALRDPATPQVLPPAPKPVQPVPLWLHPEAPVAAGVRARSQEETAEASEEATAKTPETQRKRKAESTDMPDGKNGFMLRFRAESLFSWAEFVKVNRATDDDEDPDAASAADDLDQLTVARDNKRSASRIRFDLDLPAEADDDTVLESGTLLPEWHYKKQRMLPDMCRIHTLVAADAPPCALPQPLARTARLLRRQFQALTPQRTRLRNQHSGSDVDLDALMRYCADRASGAPVSEPGLYLDFRNHNRDLACLLLADLSLSTDAWINNSARVIDVIRDSLFLFSEALSATGDSFALYGFSSVRRDNVRFHLLKGFDERYNPEVRGRLAAIKPGFYTRMGAAIRQSTQILSRQKSGRRLLLILTDGKPNDLDQYEGRYGIEDTRVAIHEARQKGLTPFCVTIDEKAGDYLPHLFGSGSFVVVRNAAELPQVLPRLYVKLTCND